MHTVLDAFEQYWLDIQSLAPSIIVGAILFLIFYVLAVFLRHVVRKELTRRSGDRLSIQFVSRGVFWLFILIGTVIFLDQVGLTKAASGVLAGAGVSALILGFAFKDIGENFLAGFFLAFGRPFYVGNVIEVDGLQGTVKEMNLRSTHIRTFDGKDIYLPNALLIKQPLINYTKDGLLRHKFRIGIAYDSQISKALNIIRETLKMEGRIEQEGELSPFIQIEEFGNSSLQIEIYYWINSFDFSGSIAALKSEIMNNVFQELDGAGIYMPSDTLELKMAEGESLRIK